MNDEDDLKAFNKCYAATILPERRANERDDAMTDDRIMTADELMAEHGILIRWDIHLERWDVIQRAIAWAKIAAGYLTEIDARRAATEIVRAERKPKVEKIEHSGHIDELKGQVTIAHQNLYRITDPDGTVRVVQRLPDDFAPVVEYWTEDNFKAWGMPPARRAAYNAAQHILRDQRAIREVE